jgi:hypothetical protein
VLQSLHGHFDEDDHGDNEDVNNLLDMTSERIRFMNGDIEDGMMSLFSHLLSIYLLSVCLCGHKYVLLISLYSKIVVTYSVMN